MTALSLISYKQSIPNIYHITNPKKGNFVRFSCCTITPQYIFRISSTLESMCDQEIKTWTIIKRF